MKKTIFLLIFCLSFNLFSKGYTSQPATKQDQFLNEKFFLNKKNGIFVDIGAHDGFTHSNTYFFEKHLKWTGICVEPMPNIFEKLKVNRSCVCLNCCITDTEGFVKFIHVLGAPNMLSGIVDTYDPRHLERLKIEIARDGGTYKIIDLPSRKFNNILKENNITRVDYLTIDVEGAELKILKSIDFDNIYIYAISIENNYNDPNMRKFLESKGFRFIAFLGGQDEIYINSKK